MRQVIFQDTEKIEFLDQRWYKMKGKEVYYPSVTTVLDAFPKPPQFFTWLKENGQNADEIRDTAADVGSKVHNATEHYDNGNPLVWDDKQYSLLEWQLLCKYHEFTNRFKPELIANEQSYCSEILQVGGTLDRVVRIGDKNWLIDIKTSNAVYEHYFVQLTAYYKMFIEVNPEIPIDHIGILWLKAKTRTEGKSRTMQGIGWQMVMPDNTIEYYWDLWEATYKLWRVQNPNAKPLNKVYPATLQREF